MDSMYEIAPIRPDQVQAARMVIYTVAYGIWHDGEPREQVFARYDEERQLADMEDIRSNYFENGGTFLVVTSEGRVIGTGALRRYKDEAAIGEIRRLWLLPEYHGKGLGYRMMLVLLGIAREKGYRRVRLTTDPVYQVRAYNFYLRLGFQVIPHYGDDPYEASMELEL